jgi:hypothetical protein
MCCPLPRRWLLAPPGQGYVELDIGTLRRALDGTLQHLLTGDFGLVQQLAFIGHDQLLLLLERSGTGRLASTSSDVLKLTSPWLEARIGLRGQKPIA